MRREMITKVLLLLLFCGVVNGNSLLRSELDEPFEPLSEEDRQKNAIEYANGRLSTRNEDYQKIRDAASNVDNKTDGLTLNLGAHHQLNQLSSSFADFVSQAEFYNDYIGKFQEGLSEDDKIELIHYNSRAIDTKFPGTDSMPVYPDCKNICDESAEYRTFDGTCNNLENCVQGSKGKTFKRLIPAQYDGIDGPRKGDDPNPMNIAFRKFNITSKEEQRITSKRLLTQMVMTWGQFFAHDKVATPARSIFTDDKKPINIDCTKIGLLNFEHCLKFGWSHDLKSFIRSAPGIVDHEKAYRFGQREQFNLQTAFLDGSHIYGTSEAEAKSLYNSATGKLIEENISPVFNEAFPITRANQYCENKDEKRKCFVSGDTRINVQLGLQMLHTLFLREHNRIAEFLAIRTDSDGDTIFQEVRRIIGAFIQSISYNDYLPLIVGKTMVDRYSLDPKSGTTYNDSADATIYNSYATAALRYGHSQIYNMVRMANSSGHITNKASVHSTLFSSDRFYEGNGYTVMQRYLMGLALEKCDAVDSNMASQMTFNLFQTKSKIGDMEAHTKRGLALAALNVLRGRDHGLPSCGDFMDHVEETTGDKVPDSQNPVKRAKDLFLCGLSEEHLPDAETGPLFNHIISTQAKNTMYGDRYFYSHKENPKPFSAAQRAEIEKVSLAQIMCRFMTTDILNRKRMDLKLTKNVFLAPEAKDNGLMDCDEDILPGSPDLKVLFPLQ